MRCFWASRFWVGFRLPEIAFLADTADSALLQFFGMAVVMVVVGSGPPLPEPYVKKVLSLAVTPFMPW